MRTTKHGMDIETLEAILATVSKAQGDAEERWELSDRKDLKAEHVMDLYGKIHDHLGVARDLLVQIDSH